MAYFSPVLRTCATGILLSSILIADALAQAPGPSSAQPGRATERLRFEPERPAVGKGPLITVEGKDGSQSLSEATTFVLQQVIIENATVFTPEELTSDYSEYIGKRVGLGTLNKIADKITARYRNAGYILSRAVVVPQRIKNGEVTIRIIEGSVDQVIIQGDKTSSRLLSRYADKIKNSKPLDIATLERYLLLMEDLPGVTAHATLRPSANVSGASDVIITLDEKAVNLALTADNRGTRFLGQGQGSITGSVNNMLGGVYEKTQLRFLNTFERDELHYGELRHEEQLGSEGTVLALSGALTRSDAGHTLKNFDVIGDDLLLSTEITHPFIRSREKNLYGSVQYDYHKTEVEALNVDLYEDILNVFRIGTAYDFVDTYSGVNRMDIKLSKGMGWDDNSSTGSRSRAGGRTNFLKANAEVSRMQPISGPFAAFVSASGQISNRALLSAEQFGVGGSNYGSAYDPSEIVGDNGIAGRAELQFTDQDRVEWIPTYQLYSFYDVGRVTARRPSAGQDGDQSLASTGLGVRFNTSVPLSGGLELAIPLTRKVAANGADGSAPRAFFNLAYKY